jgi:hypothetical protein
MTSEWIIYEAALITASVLLHHLLGWPLWGGIAAIAVPLTVGNLGWVWKTFNYDRAEAVFKTVVMAIVTALAAYIPVVVVYWILKLK